MTTPRNMEKEMKSIEKELEYVATYANPERREELSRFLKGQMEIVYSLGEKAMLEKVIGALKNERDELLKEADAYDGEDKPNARSRCKYAALTIQDIIGRLLALTSN